MNKIRAWQPAHTHNLTNPVATTVRDNAVKYLCIYILCVTGDLIFTYFYSFGITVYYQFAQKVFVSSVTHSEVAGLISFNHPDKVSATVSYPALMSAVSFSFGHI